jgi:hypothetical protein
MQQIAGKRPTIRQQQAFACHDFSIFYSVSHESRPILDRILYRTTFSRIAKSLDERVDIQTARDR